MMQIYISASKGTGLTPQDAIRPVFDGVNLNGGTVEGSNHVGRGFFLVLVNATPATLDEIELTLGVTKVLPVRALDRADYAAILDTPLTSLGTPQWRTAALVFLETKGFPTDWITNTTTMRMLLRRMVRLLNCSHNANVYGFSVVNTFLSGDMSLTVSQVPAVQRTAVAAWLSAKGIDTAWIVGTTTVREVLNRLPDYADTLYGGVLRTGLGGEVF